MSEVEEQPKEVDQITKEPDPEATKIPKEERKKDPKKVGAGKALAKKNKEAREAKKKKDEEKEEEDKGSIFSNIGIGTMIGIGGLALGVGNLYLRWKEDRSSEVISESSKPKEPTKNPKNPKERKKR